MFDKIKFANILKKINIIYENQVAFAEATDVNRTYLSQYMNMKLDSPPTPKILRRIAKASKEITTYNELMNICGYTDNLTDSFFDESIKQNNDLIPIVEDIFFNDNNPVTLFYGTDKQNYLKANFVMEKNKEYFGYKVKDDSMLPLLGTGDIAIIEKTNTYKSGNTCLICLDNKDVFIRKIIEFNDYIELHTAFPYSQPIKLFKDEIEKRNFKVLGKVIRIENSSAFREET